MAQMRGIRGWLLLPWCLFLALGGVVEARTAEIGETLPESHLEALVEAIYLAEGGARAVKPFGILSVPCSGYEDCQRICRNTVRNNHRRWLAAGQPGPYLEFLARRYAPVGVANDPTGLNKHWLNNVRKLYEQSHP